MFNKFKGLISFFMAFVFLFNFSFTVFASSNTEKTISLDNYQFKIEKDNSNEVVVSIVEDNQLYTGTFNKLTHEIELSVADYNPYSRSSDEKINFNVNIQNYDYTEDSKIEGLSLVDENGNTYTDSDSSTRIAIPIGWLIAEAVLKALLNAALAILIGGMTYVVATEAMYKLDNKKYEYFYAILKNNDVWISNGMTKTQAQSRVMRNSRTDGVWAINHNSAKNLVDSFGRVRGPELHCDRHGSYMGYYYHYHTDVYQHSHIWYR